MQRHSLYLNSSYNLLTDNGVDVYVETDAFTLRHNQLETVRGLLNW